MLRFKQFISEDASHNHAKGVSAEIHTGYHLMAQHGIPVTDHRDPEAMTKADQENRRRLGDDRHDKVKANSGKIASAIGEYLKTKGVTIPGKKGKTKIDLAKSQPGSKVSWTSQAGDIGRATGHDEGQENPSDIVLTHHDGKNKIPVGVSLKYGKNPGLRSPGHGDMQKMLNTDKLKDSEGKSLTDKINDEKRKIGEKVDQHITPLLKSTKVGDRKDETKLRKRQHESGEVHDPKFSDAVDKGFSAANEHRKKMAKHYADAFNHPENDHHTRRAFVKRMMGIEDTKFPVIKAHYDEKKDKVHVSDPKEQFENMDTHFHHYSAEAGGEKSDGKSGITIYGHHHDGTKHKIFSIQHKFSSGAYTGEVNSSGQAGAAVKKYGESPYKGEH